MKNFQKLKASFLGDSLVANWFSTSYFLQLINATNLNSVQDKGISGSTISNIANQFTGRVAGMAADAHLAMIWGGTNDWGNDVVIGASNSANEAEFNGGLNSLITALTAVYGLKNIIFLTPMQRNYNFAESVTNGLGLTISDYCDAIYAKCEDKSIPVVDICCKSGINRANLGTYTNDGLHPNTAGYNRLGLFLGNFINQSAPAQEYDYRG